MLSRFIILTLVSACLAQYTRPLFENPGTFISPHVPAAHQAPQQQQQDYYRPKKVPPQILSHKQSQNHDGQFKYAFHAENGLAQGEVISPDGTRNGGYTYVDPAGKKILVKYSAGKEGFRIIESSDHIPKAIYGGQAAQHSQGGYSQGQQAYGGAQAISNAGGGGGGGANYQEPKYQSSNSNSVEDREHHDEPGKAYSFGTGYHFEFNG